MTREFRLEMKVSRPSNHIQTHRDGLYNVLIVSVVMTNTHLILMYVHSEIIVLHNLNLCFKELAKNLKEALSN